MTDITDRLRLEYEKADDTDTEQTLWDAKDEIERLRVELEKKRDLLGKSNALARIRLDRVAELEATLAEREAVADGVCPACGTNIALAHAVCIKHENDRLAADMAAKGEV